MISLNESPHVIEAVRDLRRAQHQLALAQEADAIATHSASPASRDVHRIEALLEQIAHSERLLVDAVLAHFEAL